MATLVREPLLDKDVVERLAQTIHERYVAAQLRNGETMVCRPSLVGWDDLADTYKEASRRQAAHIGDKLAAIGCHIARSTGSTIPFEYTADEIEILAEMEHERWCADRIAAGWTYGDERDDAARTHPSLVPWRRLCEPERDKDRDAVRLLPDLLRKAGFHVVRRAAERSPRQYG